MARSGGITVKGAPASAEQKRILSRALELAHRWNAPYKAKVALVEALIVESEAKNLRSTSADGYGSFGVLQGREAYHKRSDLLDPDYQVGVFLGKGRGGKKTGRKGFTGRGNAIGLSKSGMKSGDIAQAIEGSAYPDRYQGVQREAMRIVRELSPQFASGGVKATGSTTVTLKGADTQQLDRAAYQKAKGQAVLGAFLKKRNPNNPLLKLGVVSAQDPNPADFVKTVKGKTTKVKLPGQKASAAVSDGGGKRPASQLLELFWRGEGGINVKKGQRQPMGFVSGHTDHVHVATGPRQILSIAKLAKQLGLHVGENAAFGGVAPVHATNSYHYQQRSVGSRKVSEAIDVSGDPRAMRRFAHQVARRYGVNG